MFSGMMISVVEPGTVVVKDNKGNEMIVTDESAVFQGSRAWVTQKVFDALKCQTKGPAHD